MTTDTPNRDAKAAHERIDDLLLVVTRHTAACSAEGKAQNARLARLERILISSAGATIALLVALLIR
jgi:hypothetical protein